MDSTLAIVALLVTGAAWGTALWGKSSWLRMISNIAWLGVLGGFLAIYFEQAKSLPATLATATFGMIAVMPATLDNHTLRRIGSALAAAVALAGALVALLWTTEWSVVPSQNMEQGAMILITALLCGVGITTTFALGSGSLQNHLNQRALALFGVCVTVVIFITGNVRGTLPGWDYAVSMEGMRWQIPVVLGTARNFGFDLFTLVPALNPLLIGLVASLLVLGVWTKAPKWLWLLPVAGSLGGLGILWQTIAAPSMPSVEAYTKYASSVRASQGVPETLIAQGGFVGKEVVVPLSGLLVDFGLFILLVLTCMTALRLVTAKDRSGLADVLAHLWARDLGRKAVASGWATWVVSLLLIWRLTSTYGYSAPVEWWSLGSLLAMTGAAVLMRMPGGRLREASAHLLVATWVFGVLISVAFGHLFGVPIS